MRLRKASTVAEGYERFSGWSLAAEFKIQMNFESLADTRDEHTERRASTSL
jgi:hypothetical protein